MASVIEPDAEAKLPDQYELIDGEIREVPKMSGYSAAVANRLNTELAIYGRHTGRGSSWMDTIFRVPQRKDPNRNRKPDVAFVTFERWPETRPMPYRGNPVEVVPDLVVEVVSPTDEMEDIQLRVRDFLRAGCRLVWVVLPGEQTVMAYTSPTSIRVFTDADTLDGGDVLPGFAVPVVALFPPLEAPNPPAPDDV